MEYVSNSQFTDNEFHKWKVEVSMELLSTKDKKLGPKRVQSSEAHHFYFPFVSCLFICTDGEEGVKVTHHRLYPSQSEEAGGNEKLLTEGGRCGEGM